MIEELLVAFVLQSFDTFTQNEDVVVSEPVTTDAESVPIGCDVSPATPRYH